MSDCVLQAIRQYVKWLRPPGGPQYPEINEIYHTYRSISGHSPSMYTFIGIVPTIAQSVGNFFNLETRVEVDPSFTYPTLYKMASLWERALVMPIVQVGITEGPGVYCGFFTRHATFISTPTIPKDDLIVMSIKYS